jgi:hypothetical protein
MKKKLIALSIALMGVVGALSAGVPRAEASDCGYVCGGGCCDWCCTVNGKLVCSQRPVCN